MGTDADTVWGLQALFYFLFLQAMSRGKNKNVLASRGGLVAILFIRSDVFVGSVLKLGGLV